MSSHLSTALSPAERRKKDADYDGDYEEIFEAASVFDIAAREKNSATKDLLLAMAICHESKTKGERESTSNCASHVHLDEEDTLEILSFANAHQVSFECACNIAEQLCYIIKTDDNTVQKVVIIHKFAFSSAKFAVIVQFEDSSKCLFIRETASSPAGASQTLPSYLANAVSADKKLRLEGYMAQMKQ